MFHCVGQGEGNAWCVKWKRWWHLPVWVASDPTAAPPHMPAPGLAQHRMCRPSCIRLTRHCRARPQAPSGLLALRPSLPEAANRSSSSWRLSTRLQSLGEHCTRVAARRVPQHLGGAASMARAPERRRQGLRCCGPSSSLPGRARAREPQPRWRQGHMQARVMARARVVHWRG